MWGVEEMGEVKNWKGSSVVDFEDFGVYEGNGISDW